jgi:hypothetical protein
MHVLHIDWIEHRDKDGNLLWREEGIDNILHDTGEIALLSAYFATGMSNYGAPVANLYLGLDSRTSLAEGDTLATINGLEPTTGGYARKALSTAGTGLTGQDFYINQPAAYYRADSKVVTWTASGAGYVAMKNLFLCSHITAVADGDDTHLIASLALSQTRTLADGDSLTASMYVGLSE